MLRRPRSVATRVTAIATAASAVVMALLLAGVFVVVTRQLAVDTESGLRARSADLEAALSGGNDAALAAEPFAQLGEGPSAQLSPALRGAPLVPPGTTVASDVLLDHDLPRRGREDDRLQVLARRLPDGRLLAVGMSRRSQEETGEQLLGALAVAGPVLLLLVAAVVARSVHAALQPVEQLARQARQISAAEDTGRRLPPVPGDDEIAELYRTLDAMLARLAIAFEHERAFVDDASHELRTPLAVLRGELELALSDLDDGPGVEQSLRAALGEAERLSRLADDLLLLARERAGSLHLRADPLDLDVLLRRTADRLGPHTGLALQVRCPPLRLRGDPDRLEQVLSNLLVNASAAGARQAVVLRLAAGRAGAPQRRGRRTGLPARVRERGVRPLHPGRPRSHALLGSGARACPGRGGGAGRRRHGARWERQRARWRGGAAGAARRRAGVRALVVEDDPGLSSLLQRALTKSGWTVVVAETGENALWHVLEHDFDAVLLDLMIPAPDGLEVCRRMRAAGRWAPVLLLTARDAVADRVAGLDAGADDYLTKPFALAELHARLRAITRREARERPVALTVGDLVLDPVSREVHRGGTPISLSPTEHALLEQLMRSAGRVLSRTHLLEHVWDEAYEGDSNVVDVYVRYLRNKIDRPFGRDTLLTVRGVGYRLLDDGAAPAREGWPPGRRTRRAGREDGTGGAGGSTVRCRRRAPPHREGAD